jgi:superoxide dismutase
MSSLMRLFLGVAALDFFGYLAHLLLHKSRLGWRFHRVHHSEMAVDVTTAFRQHPGETVWRILWQLAAVVVFGLPSVPAYIYGDLKREELHRTGSVVLHEHYFANLGGDNRPGGEVLEAVKQWFGSYEQWEAEFRKTAQALGGGSGWAMLTYNLYNSRCRVRVRSVRGLHRTGVETAAAESRRRAADRARDAP